MIDRQDIDALLISALYGELTPADEARLQAHLESHPADKTALADLTLARTAVRESRFLTVQLEPPQAVSALLLQEASRRSKPVSIAQERSEGWFARFVSSFARHPAMAAAAMLVVVIGVAGAMYARNAAPSAERTTETFAAEGAPARAPAIERSKDTGGEGEELQRHAGSAFEAQLAPDTGVAVGGTGGASQAVKDDVAKTESPKEGKADAKVADKKPVATPPRTYLAPEAKPTPKPMDLEAKGKTNSAISKNEVDDESAYRVTRKPGQTTPPRAPAPPGLVVVPRNDPAIPNANGPSPAPKTVGRGSSAGPSGGDNVDNARDGKESEETRWAREQHGKVASAVRANNCKEATSLAMALFNRAPAYYSANVETDRDLKQCMTYITAERDREIERTQRARAVQRRNADEAAKRPSKAPAPTTTDHK